MAEFTITVPQGCKINGSVADERSRYAIDGVLVAPSKSEGKAWLCATDGRHLAAVCTYATGTVGRVVVQPDSIKSARSMTINGKVRSEKGSVRSPKIEERDTLPADVTFPPLADVMPKGVTRADGYNWIGLNANLLRKLADSIGDGQIAIGVPPNPCKPIAAIGFERDMFDNPIGVGVLMPINTGAPNGTTPEAHSDTIAAKYEAIRAKFEADSPA